MRKICDDIDAVLIVDGVRAGFLLARDCSWSLLGVEPDLNTWGKVLSNSYPISAQLGSDRMREAARSIFVTGSFWFSAMPMAAAVEALRLVRESDCLERMVAIADQLCAGIAEQALRHGFALCQMADGPFAACHFPQNEV